MAREHSSAAETPGNHCRHSWLPALGLLPGSQGRAQGCSNSTVRGAPPTEDSLPRLRNTVLGTVTQGYGARGGPTAPQRPSPDPRGKAPSHPSQSTRSPGLRQTLILIWGPEPLFFRRRSWGSQCKEHRAGQWWKRNWTLLPCQCKHVRVGIRR